MRQLLLVCLGGAVGTGARYLIGLGFSNATFPVGTLTVNVVGSFLMGALAQAAVAQYVSPTWQAVLAVGVLGGFTTYSAFNENLLRMLGRGEVLPAILYFSATFGGCLLAGVLGAWVMRRSVVAG